MVGVRVQLYLKTPLFPFHYEEDGKRRTFPSNIVVVEGELKGDGQGGYWLDVALVGDGEHPMKAHDALKEAIIPVGKVDFLRVVDG